MKFIELTRHSCPNGRRLLLNINNIASIYLGIKAVSSGEYEHVTVIQETTSADNYWEVTETIDEVIALLRKQDAQEEYQTSLKAEIAQLKKDKLEFNAQCFHKDETISVLKNRITELEFDNRSLVEQMNKMVKKIAYKWKCPYCHEGDIAYGLVSANIILHDHILDCICNPANMKCHSCIHKKGEKCERYNMGWLSAYILRQDVNHNCFSWECRDRLKKVQEKLNKDKQWLKDNPESKEEW